MKKQPINISALNYEDTHKFIIRFIKDFESSKVRAATDANFNNLLINILQQAPLYEKALKQIKAKKQAEALLVADRDRDKKFFTLRRAIFMYRYSDNLSEQEAYQNLKTLIRTFVDAEKNSFETETQAINDFIDLLRSSENLPRLKVLNIEQYVNNLELVNSTFSTLLVSREAEVLEDTLYATKILRKKLLNIYRELAEYVFVMAKRKHTLYYFKTLTALNEGRIHFADLLAKEQGRIMNNQLKIVK